MKSLKIKTKYLLTLLGLTLLFSGCEKDLEEVPYSQFSPENFLTTENGLDRVLTAAYAGMQWHEFDIVQVHYLEEGPTDLFFETGGGQNKSAQPIQDWNWDPQHAWIEGVFRRFWGTIRDANLYLANVENIDFVEKDKTIGIAEARFIRAFQYYWLTKWFGEVPLLTSPDDDLYPEKASLESLHKFIESELLAAAGDLPEEQPEYGRATKGAALGVLTKFYLNTKQWSKAIETADKVINLGKYALYPDYLEMFAPENEINSEFIFVMPQVRVAGFGNQWMALSRPPRYPITSNQANFAAQFRYYDDFVNSFDSNDERSKFFLTEYTDIKGKEIQLLGNNNSRSFKFNDPDSEGRHQENDFPIIRYADILLAKAEALNEIHGPTQEAIDLINMIRNRAHVDPISLGNFSKESLRDHILKERAWEFYSEGKRRSDLLRQDKFIQQALDRGINAEAYRKLYPIPQRELDANPNLTQNDGY